MIGVSIVITCWNHELFLPRSVTSALRAVRVLREQGLDGEVLVIDDESRDGVPSMVRQFEAIYADDGFRALSLSANSGLRVARNFGLRHAKFPYVQQLDSDNEIVSENLPCILQAMRDTNAASAYGNLLLPDRVFSNESFQDRIFKTNYVDAMCLFDRQQLIDVGCYSGIHGLEDWEMNLHLASLGRKVVFVPVAMGIYHVLPNSLISEANVTGLANEARYRRCFNQIGMRDRMPMNTRFLRYHPSIGLLT